MTQLAPSLAELAGRFGIATDYEDWSGRRVNVPESTLVAVLAALGVAAVTEPERSAALTAHERAYWSRALPPTILARPGAQTSFWVHVTHGQPAEVWLQLEDGTVRAAIPQVDNFTAPFDLDGRWVGEATFVLPDDLPLGYHRVHLRSGAQEVGAALIVTPGWLGLPERLGVRRAWGLATQSHSVRSRQSWGVGDLTDSRTWRSGRRRCMAPVMSWSIRCTRPHRPRRWSRRRICRFRGASSARCISGLRPSRNSRICASAAGCGDCATTFRNTPPRSTPSTVTAHGQPSGRP